MFTPDDDCDDGSPLPLDEDCDGAIQEATEEGQLVVPSLEDVVGLRINDSPYGEQFVDMEGEPMTAEFLRKIVAKHAAPMRITRGQIEYEHERTAATLAACGLDSWGYPLCLASACPDDEDCDGTPEMQLMVRARMCGYTEELARIAREATQEGYAAGATARRERLESHYYDAASAYLDEHAPDLSTDEPGDEPNPAHLAHVALVELLVLAHEAGRTEVNRRNLTDEWLHPEGRCTCGGEGRCDWCWRHPGPGDDLADMSADAVRFMINRAELGDDEPCPPLPETPK